MIKNPIGYVFKKELLEIKRTRLIFLLLMAPVVQTVIFGFVATTDIKNVETLICDRDRTPESRRFIDYFRNSDDFKVLKITADPGEIDRGFRRNEIIVSLWIPLGFSSEMKRGKRVKVQILIDGSDPNKGVISLNRAAAMTGAFSQDIARKFSPKISFPTVETEERVWYNPGLESADSMVPGVIGLILLIVTLQATAVSIVREKESGNIEQVVVTPIHPYEVILGKTLPYIVIGMVDIALTTVVSLIVFGAPFQGSFLLLLGLSFFIILANLGMGIFISIVSSTQQQAMLGSIFFMLPNILLSGFAFPIANMPDVLQYFTYLIPLRYYMVIIKGIFLKGLNFFELLPQVIPLLIFGTALFTLSIKKFRKTVD
jgi:ABC-2 type transport system permease protein